MKILMLNTFDGGGGAARAALRLQKGLRGLDIDASLLVHLQAGRTSNVICDSSPLRKLARRLKGLLGLLPVLFYLNKPQNNFSPALLPDNVPAKVTGLNPDIIHLHWLCASFLRVETLAKFDKPLIWTLHDSWAFTGGCHVPFDCKKYQQRCGACPVLGSTREKDLSRWTWQRKERSWRELNLTIVAPSHWLADCARSSSLLRRARIEVIPNGLDTEVFRPLDKASSREFLGLPQEKKIILFGAVGGTSDPNKGFHLLLPALKTLEDKGVTEGLALIFGASDCAEIHDLGIPLMSLGRIDDDNLLATIYSAADVFVSPSMLENLPNTIMEAMACGTPCVAFRQGGVPELVDHGLTGYLAKPYDTSDLACGIAWVLAEKDRYVDLSLRARQKVETEFSLDLIARRYAKLYEDVLGRAEGRRHDC